MRKKFIRANPSVFNARQWRKIKKARLRLWRKKRRFIASQVNERRREEAFSRASVLRSNATPAEKEFIKELKENNVNHIFQYVIFLSDTQYRIADFYLPDYRVIVELDGSAHDIPEIRAYDDSKDARTKIQVIRIRNENVFQPNFTKNLISRFVLKNLKEIDPQPQVRKQTSQPVDYQKRRISQLKYGAGYTLSELKEMGML